jgi:uncharacterized protein (TIRG00374 family)
MVSVKKNHCQLPPIGSWDGKQLNAMSRCGSSRDYVSCKGTQQGEPKALNIKKFTFGGLLFLAFTVGVFWYQFDRIQAGQTLPVLRQLQWDYLLFMLFCLLLDTVASGLRIWIVCRVLEPGISFWTCLRAEWANMGVSMLTPSQTGGGFGQIYMLYRGGTTVATALTISLISFLGSMIGLLCIGLYSLVFSGIGEMGGVFRSAVVMFTVISALMVLTAFFPSIFQKAIHWCSKVFRSIRGKRLMAIRLFPAWKSNSKTDDVSMGPLAGRLVVLVHSYHLDVQRFLSLGKASFVWVCLLSLIFLLSRALMAFLCLRFLGIQVCTLGQVLKTQMNLIFLIYFAPTPGGSGLAEGISLSMMSHIVPIALAPYYNLLWRTTTLYLPALAGLFCLMHAVLRDTRRFVKERMPSESSNSVLSPTRTREMQNPGEHCAVGFSPEWRNEPK